MIATASVTELAQRMPSELMIVVVYAMDSEATGCTCTTMVTWWESTSRWRVLDSFGDNVDRSLGHDVTKITHEMVQ